MMEGDPDCSHSTSKAPQNARTEQDLKRKFTDTDSKWVEMILEEM